MKFQCYHGYLGALISLFFLGCPSSDPFPQYPDIASFADSPTDDFIVAGARTRVSRASPYNGRDSGCAHAGAHIHFRNEDAPYLVDIVSPVDGTIGRVEKCFLVGENDRYGVSIRFAKHGVSVVSLDLSIEPMDGFLCSSGKSGSDNGYYHSFLLVKEGDHVVQGQIIGKMYKPNTGNDNSHIHFHLRDTFGGFFCPNIFSKSVADTFGSLYGSETCSGMPYSVSTFCNRPALDEDLTGL